MRLGLFVTLLESNFVTTDYGPLLNCKQGTSAYH